MSARTGSQPRHGASVRVSALVLALAAAVVLVATSQIGPAAHPAVPVGRVEVGAVWPRVSRAVLPNALPDGTELIPVILVDARTALVQAPTPDGRFARLMLWLAGDRFRELRRLPMRGDTGFSAFAAVGDELVWAETDADGAGWLRTGKVHDQVTRELTGNLGSTSFSGLPHDLVIAENRVYWTVSVADGRNTEIRSVALAGGAVDTRQVEGSWTLSVWPWLSDNQEGQAGTSRLMNLSTGRETRVKTSEDDLARCSPTWCWVWVLRRHGPARIDLMRPDGSDRRTINPSGGDVETGQVVLADRFVVLTEPDPSAPVLGSGTLLVYDIRVRQLVVVDSVVSEVYGYGAMLWSATGTLKSECWQALELTGIDPAASLRGTELRDRISPTGITLDGSYLRM